MNSDNRERLLREAIIALALPAADQCRITMPGCVSCDLLDDFDIGYRCFLETCPEHLSAEQSAVLTNIRKTIEMMADDDCICFDSSVLDRPAWVELRRLAAEAMALFGWQEIALDPFIETKPGVWQRPDH